MSDKPAILVVVEDAQLSTKLKDELEQAFEADYVIQTVSSPEQALQQLDTAKRTDQEVAMLLCDQDICPDVGFIQAAKELFPALKSLLLTRYTETQRAIEAMNQVGVDYYLMKPLENPDEQLYPTIRGLLADWQTINPPQTQHIRVIGHRWSPESHQVKDFLARNQIAYQWLNVETDHEAKKLLDELNQKSMQFPVVLFADGLALMHPTTLELAEKVGLQTQAEQAFYDLIIIGAGPSGLAAAVYAASEGLRTVMIEREAPGGQAGTSTRIENYLGFPVGLSGAELTQRAVTQAKRFDVEILAPQEAQVIHLRDQYRIVELTNGSKIHAHTILITTGVTYRTIDAPGVERLIGCGVYYGSAVTETASCEAKDVFIVGAGNSAGQAAIHYARVARRVYLLVRGESLDENMSKYLIDQLDNIENIEVKFNTELVEAQGTDHLERVILRDQHTQRQQHCDAAALLILIGAEPHTEWLKRTLALDSQGYILTGTDLLGGESPNWKLPRAPYTLESSVPGIFAAGDVRANSVKRVASAIGEGAMAVNFIHQYLNER